MIMSMPGKGRGWRKGIQDVPEANLKPGIRQIAIEKDERFDRINNVDITDIESIKSITSPIANLFPHGNSEENKAHITKFCELSLVDRTFAVKFVLSLTNATNTLHLFMSCLQKFYDRREEINENNPMEFINLVFFMGEIYHRLRSVNRPLYLLDTPLMNCVRMLLETAGEDEIQMAVTQIAINGRALFNRKTEGFSELFIYAREVLTTRNLSTRSRGMLLLMIELYNQKFMPLSGDLQTFYVNQLGQATLLEMQRNAEDLLIITNPEQQENAIEKSSIEPGILIEVPPKPKKNNPKNFSPRGDQGGRPMSSVPRAIRGSGAIENHEQKNRNFDSQRSHRNEGNKGYGHDDRFSKDY